MSDTGSTRVIISTAGKLHAIKLVKKLLFLNKYLWIACGDWNRDKQLYVASRVEDINLK
jgi:hypothetical protein